MISGPVMRPLAESLGLVALEIGDLVRLGDKLERMVTRLSLKHGVNDPELVAEGQAADLLSQRLAGVAAFLKALSESAPADATADILAAMNGLTLAEQARKLSGPGDWVEDAAPNGDLLLFTD